MASNTETLQFQAETRRLLDLVIHSLYTHKEIFLRELISNASDALDRLRFESLTRHELTAGDDAIEVRLEVDREQRVLTVRDNGIGMSRQEVVDNLGTIAKSGTRELVRQAEGGAAAGTLGELIGQFGVGFYSAFMVADRVDVVTRRAGEEEATRWSSDGGGEYTVEPAEKATRGTTITLHLKPADEENELEDYTDPAVLRRIVRRYSDFVTYPVKMRAESTDELDTLNSGKPIWTRPASEVPEEEYTEFYRHIAHDWSEPAVHWSFSAEGRTEYRALVFVPKSAPFFWDPTSYGLQLYARRVMIMEQCPDVLPPYLRFVKGVVDASDLPLNVSREMLQHDRQLGQIRRWLTRKVLEGLQRMAENESERFLEVWKAFGRLLKEGAAADSENRDRLVRLLRFPSSNDPGGLTSLADYVARMKEGQEAIYYHTGESRAVIERSPHLEAFRARGLEVLFLDEPIDELVVQWVEEFEGKKLKAVGKGEVELGPTGESEEPATEDEKESLAPLLASMAAALEEHVKEVRLSKRLTTSPACLVSEERDVSPQLEKILRAAGSETPNSKRILEVNPDHAVIAGLRRRHQSSPDDPTIAEYARLLYGYAQLAEGSELADPGGFTALIAELMKRSL